MTDRPSPARRGPLPPQERVRGRTLPPYPVPVGREGEQACAGEETDRFFPGQHDARTTADAKATCRSCAFLDACLAYALTRPTVIGVWGATSDDERRAMRRQASRRRAA